MIITGEKIQQLCDIYLGTNDDFNWNPQIRNQTSKHFVINDIHTKYNNPYLIFCYGYNISILSKKIGFFTNNFILVTHNSDVEIRDTNEVQDILKCEKLEKWYGQNICFEHPKLHFLPIGIANSMWAHGNLSLFQNELFMKNLHMKSKKIYFNFNIDTNKSKREICFNELKDKLVWLQNVSPLDNLSRLKEYEFCVCPEGNGVDTHRLWECLYLKVVPIVIKSEFTHILLKNNIPLVVLNRWEELDINTLNYNNHNFDDLKFKNVIDINYYLKNNII